MEAADALQMIRVTRKTRNDWKFDETMGGNGNGGKEGLKRKVRKWSSFYGTTRRGGKGDEGKGQGDGWSFLGPTDQEIGNIKSCESKNVG